LASCTALELGNNQTKKRQEQEVVEEEEEEERRKRRKRRKERERAIRCLLLPWSLWTLAVLALALATAWR
jgi:hypothetical protein